MRKSLTLGVALPALLSLASAALADQPNVTLSSSTDLTHLFVGQQATITVNLQGLPVGTDFIFDLNTSVQFPSALFTPVPDTTTASGLTPGTILSLASQRASFDAVSSLASGSTTGNFSDSSPQVSAAIAQNGTYYSFVVQATHAGSGSIQFASTPGSNQYAADDTGFAFAPLPTGSPLAVNVTVAPVPEASTFSLLAGLGAAGWVACAARRKRTVQNAGEKSRG